MMSRALVALSCLLSTVACSTPTAPAPQPTTIELPACPSIDRFGNGATCGNDDPELEACGAAERRMCASSWLCFDAPEYAFCTCKEDIDCEPRSEYINSARLARQIAPLVSRCVGGRCEGVP